MEKGRASTSSARTGRFLPVRRRPLLTPDAHDSASRVRRIRSIFLHASTRPALVETADGSAHVLKLAGAGPGPGGLLTELVATRLAAALGSPVPSARPLFLPHGFPWTVGTDEWDEMVQRSFGWNLGIAYLRDACPADPAEVLAADPGLLARIAAADRLLANMDRRRANPNLLVDAGGSLRAIDHGACLFLSRALRGVGGDFALSANHLLAGAALPEAREAVGPEVLDAALADVPAAWLPAGVDAARLRGALEAYVGVWNASLTS